MCDMTLQSHNDFVSLTKNEPYHICCRVGGAGKEVFSRRTYEKVISHIMTLSFSHEMSHITHVNISIHT